MLTITSLGLGHQVPNAFETFYSSVLGMLCPFPCLHTEYVQYTWLPARCFTSHSFFCLISPKVILVMRPCQADRVMKIWRTQQGCLVIWDLVQPCLSCALHHWIYPKSIDKDKRGSLPSRRLLVTPWNYSPVVKFLNQSVSRYDFCVHPYLSQAYHDVEVFCKSWAAGNMSYDPLAFHPPIVNSGQSTAVDLMHTDFNPVGPFCVQCPAEKTEGDTDVVKGP